MQIWYIIPADKEAAFLQYIRETIPNGIGLSYIKQLLPHIPRAQMAALGAVRIVQKPGQAVITCLVGPLACRGGLLHARDLTYCIRSNRSKAFRWCRDWCFILPSPVVPARQRPPTSTSRPPTPHLLISGEAGAGMHGSAQRCDPFQMYVCTYLISTGSQSSHHSQHAPTQDLSLLPRPHTTSHQRLNLVADDRNHVAWTIWAVDGGGSRHISEST